MTQTYRVQLTRRAQRDIDSAFRHYHKENPAAAVRWAAEIDAAIATLAELPERCAQAPEGKAFGQPLRHLLLGTNRIWRIIYIVRPGTVQVVHVRHGRRAWGIG